MLHLEGKFGTRWFTKYKISEKIFQYKDNFSKGSVAVYQ